MKLSSAITEVLNAFDLNDLIRLDVGLEGDWSPTVVTVWGSGTIVAVKNCLPAHPEFKPSLELYFDGLWVGLYCYKRIDGLNHFDEDLAMSVMAFIEAEVT